MFHVKHLALCPRTTIRHIRKNKINSKTFADYLIQYRQTSSHPAVGEFILIHHIRYMAYLFLIGLFLGTAPPAAAEYPAPKIKTEKELRKVLKSSRVWGYRGYGFNAASLQHLSEKLTPMDAPALIPLLSDPDAATGASFGLAALCANGADALAVALAGAGPHPPYDRARDSLNLMKTFEKCPAALHPLLDAIAQDIDAAFQRHIAARQAQQKKEDQEAERILKQNLRQILPPDHETPPLSPAEKQEIFTRNIKALGLDGARDADQEKLYQMMKKNTLAE